MTYSYYICDKLLVITDWYTRPVDKRSRTSLDYEFMYIHNEFNMLMITCLKKAEAELNAKLFRTD